MKEEDLREVLREFMKADYADEPNLFPPENADQSPVKVETSNPRRLIGPRRSDRPRNQTGPGGRTPS